MSLNQGAVVFRCVEARESELCREGELHLVLGGRALNGSFRLGGGGIHSREGIHILLAIARQPGRGKGLANEAMWLVADRSVAARREADVDPVRRPLDEAVVAGVAGRHSLHCDRPVAELKGGARVAHRHLETEAILLAAVAKVECAAHAAPIDHVPAKVVGVEL